MITEHVVCCISCLKRDIAKDFFIFHFISITISIFILIQVIQLIVSNKTVCCGPGQRLLASYYWGESKMLVKSKSPVSG